MAIAPQRRAAATGAAARVSTYPAARLPRQRRVRRAIRHVEVMSVLKISLVLYLSVLIVSLIAGAILWAGLSAAGVTHKFEHFIQLTFGLRNFAETGLQLLLVAVLVGLILVILGTVFNVICAVLYNVSCDVVGGIQLIETEEAPPPTAPTGQPRAAQGQPPGSYRGSA